MFYVYIYLDPRKIGEYIYNELKFNYEPFYIGKGKDNRIKKHLNSNKLKKNTFKNNKIKSILNDGLSPIIIKYATKLTENEAFNLEKYLIENIGRNDINKGPLANMTDGGEGFSNLQITEETKRKISEALKGRIITITHRNKLSESLKGKKRKPLSESHKKKISDSTKSINNGFYGKKHINETKKKISESNKGKTPWNLGIPMSEEAKKKLSKSQSGKKPWNKLSDEERIKRKKERRKNKWKNKKKNEQKNKK